PRRKSPSTRSASASVLPEPAGATIRRSREAWSLILIWEGVGLTIYDSISLRRDSMLDMDLTLSIVRSGTTARAERILYLFLRQNCATSSLVSSPLCPLLVTLESSLLLK